MKPMYEISNADDIALYRAHLLTDLRRQEKRLKKDAEHFGKLWKRIAGIASGIGNVASFAAPKLNFFLTGLQVAKRLFRKRK